MQKNEVSSGQDLGGMVMSQAGAAPVTGSLGCSVIGNLGNNYFGLKPDKRCKWMDRDKHKII